MQDPNVSRKIISLLDPSSGDTVLEIGPGKGALTHLLSNSVGRIVAVEIDPILVSTLNNDITDNVEIISNDFLMFYPKKFIYENEYKIIGNLPYNITSPVIFRILETTGWSLAVFMVQKEVAERISAKPGSKIYGRLSVMAQSQAKVEYHFQVSPSVFLPKPLVNSAVISLTPIKSQIIDHEYFSSIVRKAFSQRRKKLRNSLKNELSIHLKDKLGNLRPETLSVSNFIEISNSCRIE